MQPHVPGIPMLGRQTDAGVNAQARDKKSIVFPNMLYQISTNPYREEYLSILLKKKKKRYNLYHYK